MEAIEGKKAGIPRRERKTAGKTKGDLENETTG